MECYFGTNAINTNIIFSGDNYIAADGLWQNRLNFWFSGSKNYNGKVVFPKKIKNVIDCHVSFYNCTSFNQKVIIPEYTTSLISAFRNCTNFNQPVNIPENVISVDGMFVNCTNFNRPIIIGNNVISTARQDTSREPMLGMFRGCEKMNSPVTIGTNVQNCASMFYVLRNFGAPVRLLSNKLVDCSDMFVGCNNFKELTVTHTITANNCWRMFSGCSNFNMPTALKFDSIGRGNYHWTFVDCVNFNAPVHLGENAGEFNGMFLNCVNFNAPVYINVKGNGLGFFDDMFHGCSNFNQPISIDDEVKAYCGGMFEYCTNLNSMVHIGNNTRNCTNMFSQCWNLNQPIFRIPEYVMDCSEMFWNCKNMPFAHNRFDILSPNAYCRNMFQRCNIDGMSLYVNLSITNIYTNAYYEDMFLYCNPKETVHIYTNSAESATVLIHAASSMYTGYNPTIKWEGYVGRKYNIWNESYYTDEAPVVEIHF